MEKPKRMTDVAIDEIDAENRTIRLWIDRARIEPELSNFGNWWNESGDLWTLVVDGRLVFADVARYLDGLDTSPLKAFNTTN